MEPPEEDVFLSLQRFVEKYSSNLPATINVTKRGHSHIKKRQYTVHFITNAEVVSIKDDEDNVYILQQDDKSEFGIVYDRNKEVVFQTIQDILNYSNPPNIICALQPFKGKDAKSSVEKNEVLVVRSNTKRHLKAYSITAKMKKKLSATCTGCFTTAPHMTKLNILQFRQYLANILPAAVVPFPPSNVHILAGKNIVTFAHFHSRNSLVASFFTPSQGVQFTSIPITTSIEVSVIGCSAGEYEPTPRIYEPLRFHPLCLSFSGSIHSLPLPPTPQTDSSSSNDNENYVVMDPVPLYA